MDDLWEVPPETRSYISKHEIPIHIYTNALEEDIPALSDESVIVTGLLQNADGDLLYIKHSEDDRRWEFPSGHVKNHESPEDAIRREIQEETGYVAADISPEVAIIWPFVDTAVVQIFFVGRVDSRVSDAGSEAEEISWRSEAPDDMTLGELGSEAHEMYTNNIPEEKDRSVLKSGVAAVGAVLSVAAVKAIQKYRSEEDYFT